VDGRGAWKLGDHHGQARPVWRECHDPLDRHHDGQEDRCSVGSVRWCVGFGPGGVALDQGPTRCWHRMPSGHARAPLLSTTTGLATLARSAAASRAACSRLRRVGRRALAGLTPAWQYDPAQHERSRTTRTRVDRRVGADAGRGCGDDRAGVSLRRCWPSSGCEDFLYTLKAGPAGGRLRRPSSRRQRHDGHRGTGLTLTKGACFVDRID
jgi:hypothetical protein